MSRQTSPSPVRKKNRVSFTGKKSMSPADCTTTMTSSVTPDKKITATTTIVSAAGNLKGPISTNIQNQARNIKSPNITEYNLISENPKCANNSNPLMQSIPTNHSTKYFTRRKLKENTQAHQQDAENCNVQ